LDKMSLSLISKNGITYLKSMGSWNKSDKEKDFIDYKNQAVLQILTISDEESVVYKRPFTDLEEVTVLENDTATILGYLCRKGTLSIRSNQIEIWFTNDLKNAGSPYLSVAPQIGTVLKIIRNNNFEIFAKEVVKRKVKKEEIPIHLENSREVSSASYQKELIDSRYQTINIFEDEQINFGEPIENPDESSVNETFHYSKGTVVLKKVKLPDFQTKQMVIAELSTRSNGDAYDRTGSVFIVPVDKEKSFLDAFRKDIDSIPAFTDNDGNHFQGVVSTDNYSALLELVRFFTPFGVSHFNDNVEIEGYPWADSALYRLDISDFFPLLKDEVWIGVFIGNYDKGGHKVSLSLKYYPTGEEFVPGKTWIYPLFNTVNVMEMSGQPYGTMFHNDSLTVTVNIPEGLKNLQMRFISTGHGGWGGGDEFNQKVNKIFVDGEKYFWYIPWQEDCATYRYFNPANGNFSNGMSSSDYSRSNWCPGGSARPVYIPLPDLKAGEHTFQIAIPIGEREESSFSAWNVSGCLIGEKE